MTFEVWVGYTKEQRAGQRGYFSAENAQEAACKAKFHFFADGQPCEVFRIELEPGEKCIEVNP